VVLQVVRLFEEERRDEAAAQYERAVLITRAIAAAQPDSLAAKNGLFLSALGLGNVQLLLHDPEVRNNNLFFQPVAWASCRRLGAVESDAAARARALPSDRGSEGRVPGHRAACVRRPRGLAFACLGICDVLVWVALARGVAGGR